MKIINVICFKVGTGGRIYTADFSGDLYAVHWKLFKFIFTGDDPCQKWLIEGGGGNPCQKWPIEGLSLIHI